MAKIVCLRVRIVILVGSIRFVKASFNLLAYARLAYGVISSHHIISGLLGTSIGLWHITLRPLAYLYNLLSMGKVESILSSSITAVFFTAFLIQPLCGMALHTPHKNFFGHLWHASRAIFQDIWTGVTFESQAKQEYGRNEKLGDKTSSTKTTL